MSSTSSTNKVKREGTIILYHEGMSCIVNRATQKLEAIGIIENQICFYNILSFIISSDYVGLSTIIVVS